MQLGFWSCIPILVLIIGGFATRRVTETLVLSTLVGAVLIFRGAFFGEYVGMIYEVLSNDSFQFIVILLIGIGSIIRLYEKSGALAGFRSKLKRWAGTPKRSVLITWLLCFVLFVADYLILLTASSSMKKLPDAAGVPREHLAYTVNALGASVCILVPFTSWSAFTVSQIAKAGMDFSDYVHSIPYMFFPIASVAVSFLLAAGILPKVGRMKQAYERVRAGGPVLPPVETAGASVVDAEKPGEEPGAPSAPLFNFFLPLAVLVAVTMLFGRSISHGIIAALFCMLVLYKVQGLLDVGEFFNTVFDSMKSVAAVEFVILFAFLLAAENEKMGFAPYLIETVARVGPPRLLPLFIFLIMSLVSFALGDGWSLMLISIPIFIPMARQAGLSEWVALGAVLSGLNLGVVSCLQSDALFMTYVGTGVPNIGQIRSGLPYTALTAVLSAAGFLVVGMLCA